MRALVAPASFALALIAASDLLLGWYAPPRFLPQQKLERAVAAGPGCVLLVGDSRMDAAYSPADFQRALRRHAIDRCASDLTIGATDVSGAFLATRAYLSRESRPRLVVIGKVADSLLDPDGPLEPQQMVGNNAIHLTWSRPADVFSEVPGFPFASIGVFDSGLRFLVARATALGRYQSLFSVRVQRAQGRLVGAPAQEQDRFGMIADMGRLEQDLRVRARHRLESALAAGSPQPQPGKWFTRLVDLLHGAGIPFIVVELPMRSDYRREVTGTAPARAYQKGLEEQLGTWGGRLVDLGEPGWIDEDLFADALHLNPRGAALLSSDLGERLAPVLVAR